MNPTQQVLAEIRKAQQEEEIIRGALWALRRRYILRGNAMARLVDLDEVRQNARLTPCATRAGGLV